MKGDRLVVVAADNTERQKSEMVRVLEKELKKSTQNVVFCEEISLRITKFYQAVKRNFVDIGISVDLLPCSRFVINSRYTINSNKRKTSDSGKQV